MNVLIDTNVILDVMVRREPFFHDSNMVLEKAERGEFAAWLCATTITTLFYLMRRHLGASDAIQRIRDLTSFCAIATVDRPVIDKALLSPFSDFEDAVLDAAALACGATCIVTRNGTDFRHSTLLIYSPAEFLAAIP